MVEEQKPADVEALKKELDEIKREMMRNELEDIKREKMREELEEIKAEEASKAQQQYYARHTPKLSILTVIMAVLALLAAGYMFGTVYGFNMGAEVDKYLISLGFPISGSLVVAIVSVILAFIGFGLVTVAKK